MAKPINDPSITLVDDFNNFTVLGHVGSVTARASSAILAEFIQDVVAAYSIAGTGVMKVYNDAGNTLTWSADPEYIRDTIAAALQSATGITVTPNDAADTISIALDSENLQDQIAAFLQQGANISITYNDGANTLTIAGSGGGGVDPAVYASARTLASSGNITSADAGGLVTLNGADITATLLRAGFAARAWVDILNASTTQSATISAGTDGINAAGSDTFVLAPRQMARLVHVGGADPYWAAAHAVGLELAANEHAVLNAAGTAQEARRQIAPWPIFLPVTDNGELDLGLWSGWPARTLRWRLRTKGGACSVVVRRNGAAAAGFGTPVALTTVPGDTASVEVLSQDDLLSLVVSAAAGLTGIYATAIIERTGA